MLRPTLSRLIARLAMMVSGEALQGVFNLALNLALLQIVSTHDYGVFALVMIIGGLGLTYIRSLTALPASIMIAQSRSAAAAQAIEASFGAAALLLALAAAALTSALLLRWLDHGALAGGVFIWLWSVRSHMRTVYFARGRQALASLGDVAYTVSGMAGAALALMLVSGADVLPTVFWALALANGLAMLLMLGLARNKIRLAPPRHLLRRYRKLWRDLRWSLLSVSITNAQGQGMAFLVAGLAGPAGFAPIAAALLLFAPLRILSAGFANMAHPELARLMAQRDTAEIDRVLRLWPLLLGLLGLGYLAAVLTALLFRPAGIALPAADGVLLLAWIASTAPTLYATPRIWLEIRQAYRSIALLSLLAALIGLCLVWAILLLAPAPWALAGAAVSEIVVLAGSWALVLRAWRKA